MYAFLSYFPTPKPSIKPCMWLSFSLVIHTFIEMGPLFVGGGVWGGAGVGPFPLGTWELEVGSYCDERVMHCLSIRPNCVQIVNEH